MTQLSHLHYDKSRHQRPIKVRGGQCLRKSSAKSVDETLAGKLSYGESSERYESDSLRTDWEITKTMAMGRATLNGAALLLLG